MSDVTRIACTICTPSAADRNGIRRPVSVTSQELTGLIQHFLEAHYVKADVAIATANEALDTAQKTVDLINEQAEAAIEPAKTPTAENGYGTS